MLLYRRDNLRYLTKLQTLNLKGDEETAMNRKERMAATLSGQKPDRVPVGMWYHYSPSLSAAQAAVAHFDYVRSVDLDMIKIMYDNLYSRRARTRSITKSSVISCVVWPKKVPANIPSG